MKSSFLTISDTVIILISTDQSKDKLALKGYMLMYDDFKYVVFLCDDIVCGVTAKSKNNIHHSSKKRQLRRALSCTVVPN